MKRLYIALFVLIMLLSTGISVPVYADGGLFRPQEHIDEELYETGQKAIIVYQDNIETMVLQVKYEGNVDDFAWVVPVPGYPTVNVTSAQLFEDLAYATAPIVSHEKSIGCGGVFGTAGGARTLVDVWEEGEVGVYHYAVLSAKDSSPLVNWLNDNGYAFPENGSSVIGEYINKGWYFVAAKIRAGEQGDSGEGLVQPLKLSFESNKIVYPLKISSLSSAESKVILYVFTNSSRADPVEYQHVALYTGDQVLHFPRKDNVFYQEYFRGIEGYEYDGYWHYKDDHGWPLDSRHGNFSDLLGKEDYFLTKLTAVIEADQMVDLTLVEYNSAYVQDSDGDGWSDYEEAVIIGTNPFKPDTDRDGTSDAWDSDPLYNKDIRVAIIVISVMLTGVLFYILTRKRRFWRLIFDEIRKDWAKWLVLIIFLGLLIAFLSFISS